MSKLYKSFILTPEQEKIVLPEIRKAERAYKKGKVGFVFGQMVRLAGQGDIFASAVFVEKEWADKFIKLREEYDEYMRGKK